MEDFNVNNRSLGTLTHQEVVNLPNGTPIWVRWPGESVTTKYFIRKIPWYNSPHAVRDSEIYDEHVASNKNILMDVGDDSRFIQVWLYKEP